MAGILDPLPPAYSVVLDHGERTRAARFARDEDCRIYVCAHALLRGLLAHEFGLAAEDWHFNRRPLEKPRILSQPPNLELDCSLSHTAGLVAAVVADRRLVGVDVEAVRPTATIDPELAKFVCTHQEQMDLEALETKPDRWWRAFLRLWVRKEAFAKAVGLGMSLPLPAVHTSSGQLSFSGLGPEVGQPQDWCSWEPRMATPHLACVMSQRPAMKSGAPVLQLLHEHKDWREFEAHLKTPVP